MDKHQWQSFYVTDDEYSDLKKCLEIMRKHKMLVIFFKWLVSLPPDQFHRLFSFLQSCLK